MKTKSIIFFFLFIAILGDNTFAQPRRNGEGKPKPRPERLEKFRKMRLIETLKLSEDEAVRFFAKQSAHEVKVRNYMNTRNEAIDDLENAINDKGDVKSIGVVADQMMNLDKSIFEERQRFQNEMRQFLSPEQFGRFLVFERNFGRQVRDALEEMHQDRGNR